MPAVRAAHEGEQTQFTMSARGRIGRATALTIRGAQEPGFPMEMQRAESEIYVRTVSCG